MAEAAISASLVPGIATGEGTDTLISIENLIGSRFDDTLTGSDDTNLLVGGRGNDLIQGLGGDDFILGSAGADTVDGGEGRGDSSGQAVDADDRILYQTGTGELWYDLDGTGTADRQLRVKLDAIPGLGVSDFFVI